MRKIISCLLFLSLLTLLLVTSPSPSGAIELTVSNVCSDPSVTTCFTSIAAAITAANPVNVRTGDTIIIEPGTYAESNIALKDNLPISGIETARTILKNPDTNPIFNATGLANVTISKLTIWSTSTGILANNSTVDISNNIFTGSTLGTAIMLQGTSSGQITNNTFFQNGTAINTSVNLTIQNNIFSHNGRALSAGFGITLTSVNFNLFDSNTNPDIGFTLDPNIFSSTNIPNGNHTSFNPKFVNATNPPPNMDLHLQEGSDAIGTGTPSGTDIGAFGGSGADTIPFIVSGVTVTLSGPDSATASWLPNNSYNVTNSDTSKQGGYNVHYNLDKAGPPYDNVVSVPSTTTSALITNLTATASQQPATPVVSVTGFADQTLTVAWTDVGATSYVLAYRDDTASGPTTTLSDLKTTSTILTGLTNGDKYEIIVTAVNQAAFHFSVTAFDFTVATAKGGTPGVSDESAYSTPEAILNIGQPTQSQPSDPAFGIPDIIIANPNLPKKGCFIATAAFGYYSAPQVQVLRDFRDRYLVTNGPGRAFVEWYYRYGPIGAEFITEHPWLKPVVRAALMPAIGGAYVMLYMPLRAKIGLSLLIGILSVYLVLKRKQLRSGGAR